MYTNRSAKLNGFERQQGSGSKRVLHSYGSSASSSYTVKTVNSNSHAFERQRLYSGCVEIAPYFCGSVCVLKTPKNEIFSNKIRNQMMHTELAGPQVYRSQTDHLVASEQCEPCLAINRMKSRHASACSMRGRDVTATISRPTVDRGSNRLSVAPTFARSYQHDQSG